MCRDSVCLNCLRWCTVGRSRLQAIRLSGWLQVVLHWRGTRLHDLSKDGLVRRSACSRLVAGTSRQCRHLRQSQLSLAVGAASVDADEQVLQVSKVPWCVRFGHQWVAEVSVDDRHHVSGELAQLEWR